MSEIWKDIPGYEGLYQVSNKGRIKALSRLRKNGRFRKEQVLKNTECKGYEKIKLCDDMMNSKRYFVHRLVATAFICNPDNLPCVNHKDENPSNNSVENLEWCTRQYNNTYGHRLDCLIGEANYFHKLTNDQVLDIKKTYVRNSRTFGGNALAKKYGVSFTTINKIVREKKWKHLKEESINGTERT